MAGKATDGSSPAFPGTSHSIGIALQLRSRFALARRFLRVFRFLENFQGAYTLYVHTYNGPSTAPPKPATPAAADPAEAPPATQAHNHDHVHQHHNSHTHRRKHHRHLENHLDILSRTFNGTYLLLETLTLPEALAIDGLPSLWGAHASRAALEAQRFWFLALACGVAASVLRLLKVAAYAPVPETGEGYGMGPYVEKDDGDRPDWQREQARLRRVVMMRKDQRVRWRREVRRRSKGLLRRLAADALDLVLPGSVIGWVSASQGAVGLAMLGSTILTGLEVWERCGRQVAASAS